MYSEKERAKLLIQAVTVVSTYPEIEGIVQVGSGVEKFPDSYSDIDLIFAVFFKEQIPKVRERLDKLFSDAVYVRENPLESGTFLRIFLKNGLEFDVVLLPTPMLQVRSSRWKMLNDKTGQVLKRMHSSQLEGIDTTGGREERIDWEYEIIYAIREILFEIERENFLYVMSRMEFVRDKLIKLECYYEKLEEHEFKDYRKLSEAFQAKLYATYPKKLDRETLLLCAQRLLTLFLNQHSENSMREIDKKMLDILKI